MYISLAVLVRRSCRRLERQPRMERCPPIPADGALATWNPIKTPAFRAPLRCRPWHALRRPAPARAPAPPPPPAAGGDGAPRLYHEAATEDHHAKQISQAG